MHSMAERSSYSVCMIVGLILGTLTVEGRQKYFVGGEMEIICEVIPKFTRGQKRLVTYEISKQTGDQPSRYIMVYGPGVEFDESLPKIPHPRRATFKPPILLVRNLLASDSGTYTCVTTCKSYVRRRTTFIDVNAPPANVFTSNTTVTLAENGNYTAAICVATMAKPPARIIWLEASTNRTCDFAETINVTNSIGLSTTRSILRLEPERIAGNVKPASRRKPYKCVVMHEGLERRREDQINVKLMYAPSPVTISMSPAHPKEMEDVMLQCRSTCMPKCTYKWFHYEKLLSSYSRLHLRNVSSENAGLYKCIADNKLRSSSEVIRINVSHSQLHAGVPNAMFSKRGVTGEAEPWPQSVVSASIALSVTVVLCVVILIILCIWRKRRQTRKLTCCIGGRKSTSLSKQGVDDDDDDYGFVSHRASQQPESREESKAPSTVEERLDDTTGSPTSETLALVPAEQKTRLEDFLVDVPTLSGSLPRSFGKHKTNINCGYATMGSRLSSQRLMSLPMERNTENAERLNVSGTLQRSFGARTATNWGYATVGSRRSATKRRMARPIEGSMENTNLSSFSVPFQSSFGGYRTNINSGFATVGGRSATQRRSQLPLGRSVGNLFVADASGSSQRRFGDNIKTTDNRFATLRARRPVPELVRYSTLPRNCIRPPIAMPHNAVRQHPKRVRRCKTIAASRSRTVPPTIPEDRPYQHHLSPMISLTTSHRDNATSTLSIATEV